MSEGGGGHGPAPGRRAEKGMIIVSITGPRMPDALEQLAGSDRWADAFELRLDRIRKPDIGLLIRSTFKPVIATCRPSWEGGEYRGTEEERMSTLEQALLLGARYVDIELRAGARALGRFTGRPRCRVIVSCHRPPGGSPAVGSTYARLKKTGADVLKFAFHASDAWENSIAFDFLRRARRDRQRAVAIAMGQAGEPSRVLYRVFGGWGMYAAPESGPEAASGQVTARLLSDVYGSQRLNRRTRIFGVVGHPVRQSRGILIHNPLFRQAGKNAVYCRFAVHDLEKFFACMVPYLSGFSVTHPHKVAIGRYLDELDPLSRAIGAVNTVTRKRGRLAGTNTDATAALDAIEGVSPVSGKRMIIMGAGGAARAIAYEAARRGAVVIVTGRRPAAARRLARQFGVLSVPLGRMREVNADILVNATPVGMSPHAHETPFPRSLLGGKTVFDAVYAPAVTRLLREAIASGARVVSGTEMYVNQAAMQFALYAGVPAHIPLMRRLLSQGEDS
jgi:3-dehydroquinate dehydratase/shikimate dehydrogenase